MNDKPQITLLCKQHVFEVGFLEPIKAYGPDDWDQATDDLDLALKFAAPSSNVVLVSVPWYTP